MLHFIFQEFHSLFTNSMLMITFKLTSENMFEGIDKMLQYQQNKFVRWSSSSYSVGPRSPWHDHNQLHRGVFRTQSNRSQPLTIFAKRDIFETFFLAGENLLLENREKSIKRALLEPEWSFQCNFVWNNVAHCCSLHKNVFLRKTSIWGKFR